MVSVLFYSVVFAFSLLLLLLFVLLFYLARGNTTRCQINKPALACRPQKPLQQQLGNWELQQQITHTRIAESWAACYVCVFCNLCCCCSCSYCCCLISHFFRHSHTHSHNSHIDVCLQINWRAAKICYSIFEKTLLLCAYAKWPQQQLTFIFFHIRKYIFQMGIPTTKNTHGEHEWVSGASQVNVNVNNKTHDRAKRDCDSDVVVSNRKQKSARTFSLLCGCLCCLPRRNFERD